MTKLIKENLDKLSVDYYKGHIPCYSCKYLNPIKDVSKNLCIGCGLSLPFIY